MFYLKGFNVNDCSFICGLTEITTLSTLRNFRVSLFFTNSTLQLSGACRLQRLRQNYNLPSLRVNYSVHL